VPARDIEASMASYRVDATYKESVSAGGEHRHIVSLCLEDGRRIPKAIAIRNTRLRAETYYTLRQGQRAEVEVSTQCPRCHGEYLRTNQDSTTKNNLLELPDC
jgi:Protein of unknown function (DUF3892)